MKNVIGAIDAMFAVPFVMIGFIYGAISAAFTFGRDDLSIKFHLWLDS